MKTLIVAFVGLVVLTAGVAWADPPAVAKATATEDTAAPKTIKAERVVTLEAELILERMQTLKEKWDAQQVALQSVVHTGAIEAGLDPELYRLDVRARQWIRVDKPTKAAEKPADPLAEKSAAKEPK